MAIVVLIGASGSGKTAIARSIAARHDGGTAVFHFDSIGVPSPEEMIDSFGSGEAWQRANTLDWMQKLAVAAKSWEHVLFEGQTRLAFLADAAAAAGGIAYRPLLVDCDDATRSHRLTFERKQPDLVNRDMTAWARFLREEAGVSRCPVLDTSRLSLRQSVVRVLEYLNG